MMKHYHASPLLPLMLCAALLLTACSTTRTVPEGDQLFIGLKEVTYDNYKKNDNFITTQEEVEAALATAPNGALFGSSYYRTPFPYGLWIWNAFSDSHGVFGKWMVRSFGKEPVLMSRVNPALRASVAQTVLRNHGYLHGKVDYEEVACRNPKKAKLSYHVHMGRLYEVDTLSYENFPPAAMRLIDSTRSEAVVRRGTPLSVPHLDSERSRVASLFRNNGYYYYQAGNASYLADTLQEQGKAQLRLQLADGISPRALHPWYIGNISIRMQRTFSEETPMQRKFRFFSLQYGGKKPPLRPSVILRDMKLRHGDRYSYDDYNETLNSLGSKGLFSSIDFAFTPRDTTDACDTLDLALHCILDRPYDFYAEVNMRNRTIGRLGPEAKLGVTRRNAFRAGEKIDVNLHGSYAWEVNRNSSGNNNYEYGADVSVEFPRIVAPFYKQRRRPRSTAGTVQRRRFFSTGTTLFKASTNVIQRPSYYKMHVVSGEVTYRWQSSATCLHEFSPLTVKYQYMNSRTEALDSLMADNLYLVASMDDYFLPQMRYSFTYTSPKNLLHPVKFSLTLTESGNVTSLGFMACGKKWEEKDKKLFKTPYAQFVKLETDWVKTWTLDSRSKLLSHVNAGVLLSYGNSDYAPFAEQFYVGGANDLRAFPLRGVGPGRFVLNSSNRQMSYVFQNGNIKLGLNLEYRRCLFGSLYTALFLDAGNVWNYHINQESFAEAMKPGNFSFSSFYRQLAVGTGIGFRYDLEFLVLRLDWGIGLHVPYDTGKSGFYNINSFKDNQTLHLAIGYPF